MDFMVGINGLKWFSNLSFKCIFSFTGSMFSKTEMSEVLTEICRIDPSFDKEKFLKSCEREIIPNILEVSIFLISSISQIHSQLFWQK